ncbi:MAG TPA: hypothetical protein VLA37_03175 [Sphingomonadaceae bacterium]|nr:hypothetical protein [Sphingomonadaceae bacterium]
MTDKDAPAKEKKGGASHRVHLPTAAAGAASAGAIGYGAIALGAAAIGAFAIGGLVIGGLALRRKRRRNHAEPGEGPDAEAQ